MKVVDPIPGTNIRITVAANQGGRKYMEDRVNIETIRNTDGSIKFTFLGVFDGHGGFEASDYVRKNLLANIMACEAFDSHHDKDILGAIKEGFLTTHEEMARVVSSWPRTASGYASTAGTTASVAIIRNGKVYTGHVGDSAVIIGSYRNGEDERPVYSADRLTIDHKPESLDEQARIETAGGKVAQKSGVSRVVWTRPIRGHIGPIRNNTPMESIPFLAVARSLGDLWSYCEETAQYVVSPEPDVAVRTLSESDSCMILVSDGITNVLSHNQITQYVELEERKLCAVEGDRDPTELRDKQPNHARTVLLQAMKRWSHLRADNLSAIVVVFDPLATSLDAYKSYIDEPLSHAQSVDEMFLMDPETMIHISPQFNQKLWTERVPLIYEGAVDNNFVSVDYRGPGFMTHDEEEEIESRLQRREQLRESFKQKVDEKFDELIDDDYVEYTIPDAKENLDVKQPMTVKNEEVEGTETSAPTAEDDEDGDSDEEDSSESSPPITTAPAPTMPAIHLPSVPKARSSAKRIVGGGAITPARKIAVASRRFSLVKTDTNAGTSSIYSLETVSVTGVVTRSKERQCNPLSDLHATPSTSGTPRSTLFMENGSRKRPSRLSPLKTGVTPFVERIRIDTSPVRKEDEPIVRSEPSTPAKGASNPIRASNWSLSKLDQLRAAAAADEETAEPPSKIRRMFGFVKRLVGLGNN